ncbi:GNAT family N-acetyltransferase [Corynebacterium qintianiae]|uniref:GNAT family N-acetyltransferase n=1 Tax=Corynebacterium qintianiae TaxID=2709392 RepID=A0A7T0KPU0_9CORY|nr:GNAT family N-acetyltransferase [Corynebacterium qintianiae]QPK84049.1 GNAT family N-acetyltransferase [Corynebacterium qintianiae]
MSNIRPAKAEVAAEILSMIRELAEYEKEPDAVAAAEQDIHDHLFGEDPKVFAHVADEDGRLEGMVIWFVNFSTWEGRHGIWMEDLYVRDSARGKGVGTKLLKELASIAVENGYRRVEWSVLKWNAPSIGFYTSIGAHDMGDWQTMRLDGQALRLMGA